MAWTRNPIYDHTLSMKQRQQERLLRPLNQTRPAKMLRKATFAFVVAGLFGMSTSLSSFPSKSNNRNELSSSSSSRSKRRRQHDTLHVPSTSRPLDLDFRGGGSTTGQSAPSIRRDTSPILPFTTDSVPSLSDSFRQLRNSIIEDLRRNDAGNINQLERSKTLIMSMIDFLQENFGQKLTTNTTKIQKTAAPGSAPRQLSPEERRRISETIDEACQALYVRSFASPFQNPRIDQERIKLGMELLMCQLSSSNILVSPFYLIPRKIIVQALTAVTTLQERQYNNAVDDLNHDDFKISPDDAFRLLQRLITGVGVRGQSGGGQVNNNKSNMSNKGDKKIRQALYEVDFNRVLNIYSNLGNMDMAHRVVALQERTPNAPSLSPVTYSILVKGYGKLGDWNNIDMLLQHAAASDICPDTIFFNSLMDAYINCNQFEKAKSLFDAMRYRRYIRNEDLSHDIANGGDGCNDFVFSFKDCPAPNQRSYNILLKGLAQSGEWHKAMYVAGEMKKEYGWWDHVTTNTLVQTAVKAGKFDAAEELLVTHLLMNSESNGSTTKNFAYHPNADAYTSLMDGYINSGQLSKAIALMKAMDSRNVHPNEFHFSCLVGGLARQQKLDLARKVLSHAQSVGISARKQRAIYSAFISGLLHRDQILLRNNVDERVDQALSVLRDMIRQRIFPNVETIAIILDGFSHCSNPRLTEAITLVERLEKEAIIPKYNIKVCTALVQVYAAANDLKGAVNCFKRIRRPDVTAVNALLDGAVRCENDEIALETFEHFFRGKQSRLTPDVISFSALIGTSLNKGNSDGSKKARELYNEMRYQRRIHPDKMLVDLIIKEMVRYSKLAEVQPSDARFMASVLRDAENLNWEEGQLDRRKRVVELAMRKHVARAWEEESELFGLWKSGYKTSSEEEIFQRHGWNKVDSGFNLWGAGRKKAKNTNADEFLQSKGWNDMDSGFRII